MRIESVLRDMRRALRSLSRRPLYVATVLVCFAVGVGANVATLDVVDLLLFRPPQGVGSASDVVRLQLHWAFPGGRHPPMLSDGQFPLSNVVTLQTQVSAFESVGAYAHRDLTVGDGETAHPVGVGFVTSSFFRTLGVHPALGRLFGTSDRGAQTATEAVIGYAFWRNVLNGDPAVVGRRLRIGTRMYTIIGVAAKGFSGVELSSTNVWLPVQAGEAEVFQDDHQQWTNATWLTAVARVRPGKAPRSPEREASAALQREYADRFGSRLGGVTIVSAGPLRGGAVSPTGVSVTLWTATLSLVLLLMACVNIAGLYIARALMRRTEMAICMAIGAHWRRLLRQQVAEGLLLTIVGGCIGAIIAHFASSAFVTLLLPDLATEGRADIMHIAILTVAVATIAWIGGSVIPSIGVLRTITFSDLRVGGMALDSSHSRLRSTLLVAQVALTTVMLVVAGLFVRSFLNARTTPLGIDPEQVVVAQIDFATRDHAVTARDRLLLTRIKALPGVQSASYSSTVPFVSSLEWPGFAVPGSDVVAWDRTTVPALIHLNAVSPDFFSTIRQTIMRGRAFDDADMLGKRPVAIVNEAFAHTYWRRGNALGQCVKIAAGGSGNSLAATPCREIVGIVADTRVMHLQEPAESQVFVPFGDLGMSDSYMLTVRTHGATQIIPSLRKAINESVPSSPFFNVRLYTDILNPLLGPWRLGAGVSLVFGASALVLSMFGLYGAFAFAIGRRTREIGVRLALGARESIVLRMVLIDGLRVAGTGMVLGLVLAAAVGRLASAVLFGLNGDDPVVLGIVAGLVIASSIAASAPVAIRASRVDPAVVMHAD